MVNKNVENYDINSLDGLEGAEAIRKRPASMLGSGGLDGAKHTFIEIIGNALDEVSSGYCNKIVVKFDRKDGSIVVRDYGRGVPMTWSEKKQTYGWDLVYNRLYSGGKLENPKTRLIGFTDWENFSFKNYSYLASVGLNGVGAACSQFTSEFFRVISYRDGKEYEMYFEGGYPAWDEMKVREQSEPNGTYIHWKPDSKVFSDTNITFAWIKQNCEGISYVSGVDVHLFDGDKEIVYKASDIKSHLEQKLGSFVAEGTFLHHEEEKDNDGNVTGVLVCEAHVAMGGKGAGERFYNNQVAVRGGVHEDFSYGTISKFFIERAKEQGVKIVPSDVDGKYSIIITTLANEKSYRGQTKDSIDNEYIGTAIGYACLNILKGAWGRSESWVKRILEEAIVSAQLREASKMAESKIREISKAINKPVMPAKLTSCSALLDKKYNEVELILVEGDSAGQNVISARDGRTQAVLPLKGKSLNTEKSTLEKALNNKEVTAILNVIGAGLTVEAEGFSIFDIDKSRVGKIIIMTDADVDGAHIRTLLISLLNRFTAPLLEAGIIYISIPPKYKVEATGKYYYSEEEFQQAKANGEVVGAFKRYKGLGEVDAKDLWETSLNPATRRLLQVKVDTSDTEFRNAIRVMSGSDSSIRKQMILEELLVDYDDHDEAMEVLSELYSVMDENQEEEVDYEEIYY
jgi:DNA gyrase subunit B